MLPLEKQLSYKMDELRNELTSLETFITSLGLDGSLAAKILQKAVYESIETGRPTIDILHDYCDRLRMGYTCGRRWNQYGGDSVGQYYWKAWERETERAGEF